MGFFIPGGSISLCYVFEIGLKQKWLDNIPRMSKLREHRQKRLLNRLEVRKEVKN